MATMFPPPTNSGTLQSPPQNFSAPQGHQRFRYGQGQIPYLSTADLEIPVSGLVFV